MRNLVWILVAVVIAGGAYMLYTGQTPREIATDASEVVNAPETEQTA